MSVVFSTGGRDLRGSRRGFPSSVLACEPAIFAVACSAGLCG